MSARRCDLSPLFFYSLKTFRQRSGTSRGHGWALHDDLIDGATNYGTVEVFSPRLIFRTRIVVRFLDRIRHRSSRLHLENCPSATTRTNDYMVLTWYSLRDLVYSFHPHIAPLLPPSPQARKKKQKKTWVDTLGKCHTQGTHIHVHTHTYGCWDMAETCSPLKAAVGKLSVSSADGPLMRTEESVRFELNQRLHGIDRDV